MKNTAKFQENQTVNYYGHEAIITKVSETENSCGWFTYSVRYFVKTDGYPQGVRHGQSQVEEHELKSI